MLLLHLVFSILDCVGVGANFKDNIVSVKEAQNYSRTYYDGQTNGERKSNRSINIQ